MKQGLEKIFTGLIIMAIAATILMLIKNSLQITATKIMDEKGYDIIDQKPKSIEISIDKSALPEDIDFSMYDPSINYNIPVYKTDTSKIYLKLITYANQDTEWLSMDFEIEYKLPKNGSTVVVHEVKDDKTFSSSLHMLKKEVKDMQNTYEDAASIHGIGPSNKFSVYLRSDVYELLDDKIIFVIDGFNELTYITK